MNHYEAQSIGIFHVLKQGPATLARLCKITGFDLAEVRRHCEEMRADGEISYNWLTRRYSA